MIDSIILLNVWSSLANEPVNTFSTSSAENPSPVAIFLTTCSTLSCSPHPGTFKAMSTVCEKSRPFRTLLTPS